MWFIEFDRYKFDKRKRAGTAGSFHWSQLLLLASMIYIFELKSLAQTREMQSHISLNQKEIELLANDRQWLKLLHFEASAFFTTKRTD